MSKTGFYTYQDVQTYLGDKMDRPYPYGRATRVQRRGDNIVIRYHSTDVVLFTPDYIELHSGGWRTLTTKARMNDCLAHCQVSQHHYQWYIKGAEYFDGIRLDYAGTVLNPYVDPIQIEKYADALVKALVQGELNAPELGDCRACYEWYAVEHLLPAGHLWKHVQQQELVPIILYSAVVKEANPFEEEAADALHCMTHDDKTYEGISNRVMLAIKRSVVAYLKHQLEVF